MTHVKGGKRSPTKTKKQTKTQATMKAIAMRAKHVRPNKASKDKAAMTEGPAHADFKSKLLVCATSLARLASMMLTTEEIARFYGVSLSTMNRRLRQPELREAHQRGQAHGQTRLRMAQLQTAHAGSTQMLVWLGKQYLGQKQLHIAPLSAEDELPNMEEGRVIHIPWTKELEERWKTIDAELPELNGM